MNGDQIWQASQASEPRFSSKVTEMFEKVQKMYRKAIWDILFSQALKSMKIKPGKSLKS